jgi:hypothetical protein
MRPQSPRRQSSDMLRSHGPRSCPWVSCFSASSSTTPFCATRRCATVQNVGPVGISTIELTEWTRVGPPLAFYLAYLRHNPIYLGEQPLHDDAACPRLPAPASRFQDVLVVTAPGSGAEIIPFLKTWVNLPMAIAFTVGYAKVRADVHSTRIHRCRASCEWYVTEDLGTWQLNSSCKTVVGGLIRTIRLH